MKYELTQEEVDRLSYLYTCYRNAIRGQYRNGKTLRRYAVRAYVRLYYVNLHLVGLYDNDLLAQTPTEAFIAKMIQDSIKKLFDYTRKPIL